ncbi:MAG: M23 family metallopeptidase [Rhodospirillales bacterium]|nr:M23 family metallopeptidase [Alphaproteobacteria bacterium]MCB9980845.1 M23 family metallopeptidase [Rhodospirillales bacterium]
MADKTTKRSILDDILAHVTVTDANGRIHIDASSLKTNPDKTREIQEALSEEGLYVSKRTDGREQHTYYNDGDPGSITCFGLLIKTDPTQAIHHIDNALNDTNLSKIDILKLQIALNACTDDPKEKIIVDGIIGPQTANRLADHLARQMINPDLNSGIGKALQKYAAPAKLNALGMEARRETSHRFNNSATHAHHDEHEHTYKPSKPEGSENLDTNSGNLTLQAPIKNMRITSTLKERWNKSHQGVDMNTEKSGDANIGEPISAPANAVVAYAGPAGGYGNLISLYHGHGVYTQYGHVRGTNHLSRGQTIQSGKNFAQIGNAGGVDTHLHFEVIIQRGNTGYVIDPQKALAPGVDLYDPKVQDRLIADADSKLAKNTSDAFEGRVASFDEHRYDKTLIAANTTNDKPTIV